MKRSPLQRRTPLKAMSNPSPVSERRAARSRELAKMKTGGPCQVRPYLVHGIRRLLMEARENDAKALARALFACTGQGSTRHHVRKQSAQGSDGPDNLVLCCAFCNGLIEDRPAVMRWLSETLAAELGWRRLVVREGDDEWLALGRR